MTRALVTWHLIQHDYLPIVVTRDDRDDYIDALEAADNGELESLVEFTANLHQRSILQALSSNCSELRGSEQLSAGGEGIQSLGAPGAEAGSQGEPAAAAPFRPGAAADLATDDQVAQAAFGGVVVGRRLGYRHEDEQLPSNLFEPILPPSLNSHGPTLPLSLRHASGYNSAG